MSVLRIVLRLLRKIGIHVEIIRDGQIAQTTRADLKKHCEEADA